MTDRYVDVEFTTATVLRKDVVLTLLAKSEKPSRVLSCSADEKRLIMAVAMEPGVVDAHGEHTDAEDIESAAHGFLLGERGINVEHMGDNVAAGVVESFIAPIAMELGGHPVLKGSWVVGIHLTDDALWKRAKAGDFGGVSVEGMARRESA